MTKEIKEHELTKRELFAAMAMQGLISNRQRDLVSPDDIIEQQII